MTGPQPHQEPPGGTQSPGRHLRAADDPQQEPTIEQLIGRIALARSILAQRPASPEATKDALDALDGVPLEHLIGRALRGER